MTEKRQGRSDSLVHVEITHGIDAIETLVQNIAPKGQARGTWTVTYRSLPPGKAGARWEIRVVNEGVRNEHASRSDVADKMTAAFQLSRQNSPSTFRLYGYGIAKSTWEPAPEPEPTPVPIGIITVYVAYENK